MEFKCSSRSVSASCDKSFWYFHENIRLHQTLTYDHSMSYVILKLFANQFLSDGNRICEQFTVILIFSRFGARGGVR